MDTKLILSVKRKERFCKIQSISEDNGIIKYYTNSSNLFDLRDSVSMGIYKETYHSTWDEIWEFFTGYVDVFRKTEKIQLSRYIPDWLLLDPVYISPELWKWVVEELSGLNQNYNLKEYEMGRVITWIKYRKK
ncbi:MAG: hypothetical protein RIG77_17925 [Cyclobacteriaceae bacterium]